MFKLIRKIFYLVFMLLILFIVFDYIYMDYGISNSMCGDHHWGILKEKFQYDFSFLNRKW